MNTRPPHTRRRMFHRDSDWQHSLKRDRIIASWTIYMRYKLTHLNDIHLFARIAQSLSLSSSNPLPFLESVLFLCSWYSSLLWDTQFNCGWIVGGICRHVVGIRATLPPRSIAFSSCSARLIDYCVERWIIGVNYQPSI